MVSKFEKNQSGNHGRLGGDMNVESGNQYCWEETASGSTSNLSCTLARISSSGRTFGLGVIR